MTRGDSIQAILDLAAARIENLPLSSVKDVRHDLLEIVRLAKDLDPNRAPPTPEPTPMKRVNWLPAPHFFNLNMACMPLTEAFAAFAGLSGHAGVYLVGSSTARRDYRDVDVRMMLDDKTYARLFGNSHDRPDLNALWSVMCSSIGLWLTKQSGLPVDFQIQQMTTANAEFSRRNGFDRQPLGVFLNPTPTVYSADATTEDQDHDES